MGKGPVLSIGFDLGILDRLGQMKTLSKQAGAELKTLNAELQQAQKNGQQVDAKLKARIAQLETIKKKADQNIKQERAAKAEFAADKKDFRDVKTLAKATEKIVAARGISNLLSGNATAAD